MHTRVSCNPFRKGVEDVAHDAQLPSRKIVERHRYCRVNISDRAKCLIICHINNIQVFGIQLRQLI